MAFCTKCGGETASDAAFCAKCGAPRSNSSKAQTVSAVETVARQKLEGQHAAVVAMLGIVGFVLVMICGFLLVAIADSFGRIGGGVFVALISLGSGWLFVRTFISKPFAERVNAALSFSRNVNLVTGEPYRMLWWFRWFTASLAVFMAVALSDYVSPAPAASNTAADEKTGPVVTPSPQQLLDARLALCVAAADEYETVLAGKGHKDAIILAGQYSVGEKAGGRAIGHEWFSYQDGKWRDSDCKPMSVAAWAQGEGYYGDPIELPDGAIAIVVNSHGWIPPDLTPNPEGHP